MRKKLLVCMVLSAMILTSCGKTVEEPVATEPEPEVTEEAVVEEEPEVEEVVEEENDEFSLEIVKIGLTLSYYNKDANEAHMHPYVLIKNTSTDKVYDHIKVDFYGEIEAESRLVYSEFAYGSVLFPGQQAYVITSGASIINADDDNLVQHAQIVDYVEKNINDYHGPNPLEEIVLDKVSYKKDGTHVVITGIIINNSEYIINNPWVNVLMVASEISIAGECTSLLSIVTLEPGQSQSFEIRVRNPFKEITDFIIEPSVNTLNIY